MIHSKKYYSTFDNLILGWCDFKLHTEKQSKDASADRI